MKAADIIAFKIQLNQRREQLRHNLGMTSHSYVNINDQLTAFRSKTGFLQLIYYYLHKSTIHDAAEYEALSELLEQLPIMTTEETLIFDVYGTLPPDNQFDIRNSTAREAAEKLKESLYSKISSPSVSGLEKTQAIQEFWKNLHQILLQSDQPTDVILAHYIYDRHDCGIKPKAINLKPLKEDERTPSFLLSLPQSGNIHDLEKLQTENVIKKNDEPLNYDRIDLESRDHHKHIQIETRLFGFIHLSLMENLQKNIDAQKTLIDTAKQQLVDAKKNAKNAMRPFIDGLKSLFEGWRKIEARKQAPQPTTQPVASTLVTYIADFLPKTSSQEPSKQVPPSQEDQVPPGQEKSWFDSLFSW